MIELLLIQDYELIKSLMTIPGLPEASFKDEDLEKYQNNIFEPRQDMAYFLILNDQIAVGLIVFEQISPQVVSWHWYINPKYWGTSISDEVLPLVYKYLDQTQYTGLLGEVPDCCIAVRKAALRAGLDLLCIVPRAVKWRNELVGLCLFYKVLKEKL